MISFSGNSPKPKTEKFEYGIIVGLLFLTLPIGFIVYIIRKSIQMKNEKKPFDNRRLLQNL